MNFLIVFIKIWNIYQFCNLIAFLCIDVELTPCKIFLLYLILSFN